LAVTSRSIVRTGICQFFGGTTYDTEARAYRGNGPLAQYGLATVRAFQPKKAADTDFTYGLPAGRGMGAYMIVYIHPTIELRDQKGGALGGGSVTSGRKIIRYTVTLQGFHLAYEGHSEDAGADVDNLIEAIHDLMRGDKTLGSSVVQAGESHFGIRTATPPPVIKDQVTETGFTISFEADVLITA
jgi:hypothetical protein